MMVSKVVWLCLATLLLALSAVALPEDPVPTLGSKRDAASRKRQGGLGSMRYHGARTHAHSLDATSSTTSTSTSTGTGTASTTGRKTGPGLKYRHQGGKKKLVHKGALSTSATLTGADAVGRSLLAVAEATGAAAGTDIADNNEHMLDGVAGEGRTRQVLRSGGRMGRHRKGGSSGAGAAGGKGAGSGSTGSGKKAAGSGKLGSAKAGSGMGAVAGQKQLGMGHKQLGAGMKRMGAGMGKKQQQQQAVGGRALMSLTEAEVQLQAGSLGAAGAGTGAGAGAGAGAMGRKGEGRTLGWGAARKGAKGGAGRAAGGGAGPLGGARKHIGGLGKKRLGGGRKGAKSQQKVQAT